MNIPIPPRELMESLESSICDINDAETLPPACYVDPAFFEFEKEAIFRHEWLCVGRESWVKNPGDFFTTSHIGEPVLIVRNREGRIKAMSSVCQHRAMLVADGCGNTRGFVCPYHHWAYSLDGDLVGAPEMDQARGFRKEEFGLPEIKTEMWQGFIFINFDRDALPLGPRLSVIDRVMERYDVANLESLPRGEPLKFQWNWKVMLENNNDGYHANRLHQGPLHDFIPSSLVTFPQLDPDTGGYFRYNGTLHPDASFNATQKALFKIFPKLTDEDRNRVLFVNIPPSMSMILHSDMASFSILHADSFDSISQDRGRMFMPGVIDEPLFQPRLDMITAAVSAISAQDRYVDARVQIGLQSQYAARGRYSWQEGAQSELNRWIVKRYKKAWNATYGATRPPNIHSLR